MGYSTRKSGHSIIKTYSPDDDPDTMYLTCDSHHSFDAIIEACKNKWPDTNANDLLFEIREIQTDCIGYDLYDPSDYTNFIIITRAAK